MECLDSDVCEQKWLDWAKARQNAVYIEAVADQDDNLKQDGEDLGRLAGDIQDEMTSVGQTPQDNLTTPARQMPSAAVPAPTPAEALANVNQAISDFLTGSDNPDAVTVSGLVGKALQFLFGTTLCPKQETPDGHVPLCKK